MQPNNRNLYDSSTNNADNSNVYNQNKKLNTGFRYPDQMNIAARQNQLLTNVGVNPSSKEPNSITSNIASLGPNFLAKFGGVRLIDNNVIRHKEAQTPKPKTHGTSTFVGSNRMGNKVRVMRPGNTAAFQKPNSLLTEILRRLSGDLQNRAVLLNAGGGLYPPGISLLSGGNSKNFLQRNQLGILPHILNGRGRSLLPMQPRESLFTNHLARQMSAGMGNPFSQNMMGQFPVNLHKPKFDPGESAIR